MFPVKNKKYIVLILNKERIKQEKKNSVSQVCVSRLVSCFCLNNDPLRRLWVCELSKTAALLSAAFSVFWNDNDFYNMAKSKLYATKNVLSDMQLRARRFSPIHNVVRFRRRRRFTAKLILFTLLYCRLLFTFTRRTTEWEKRIKSVLIIRFYSCTYLRCKHSTPRRCLTVKRHATVAIVAYFKTPPDRGIYETVWS